MYIFAIINQFNHHEQWILHLETQEGPLVMENRTASQERVSSDDYQHLPQCRWKVRLGTGQTFVMHQNHRLAGASAFKLQYFRRGALVEVLKILPVAREDIQNEPEMKIPDSQSAGGSGS